MIRTNRLTLIACVGLILISCGKGPEKQAQEFMELGMFDEAKTFLAEELSKRPKNAELHFLLGKCFLATEELEKAEESFGRATSLKPTINSRIGKTYSDEALTLLRIDEIDKPLSYFATAMNYDSSLKAHIASVLYDSGKVFIKENKTRNADRLFRLAVEYDARLNTQIAEACFEEGKSILKGGGNASPLFTLASEYNPELKSQIFAWSLNYFSGKLADLRSFGRENFLLIYRSLKKFSTNSNMGNPTFMLAQTLYQYESGNFLLVKQGKAAETLKKIRKNYSNSQEGIIAGEMLKAPALGRRNLDIGEFVVEKGTRFETYHEDELYIKPLYVDVESEKIILTFSVRNPYFRNRSLYYSKKRSEGLYIYDANGEKHISTTGFVGGKQSSRKFTNVILISIPPKSEVIITSSFPMISEGASWINFYSPSYTYSHMPHAYDYRKPWSVRGIKIKPGPFD